MNLISQILYERVKELVSGCSILILSIIEMVNQFIVGIKNRAKKLSKTSNEIRVKLATFVKGDLKAPLFDSYYTKVKGEGTTPFLWLLHFTLDPYIIMLSVKQSGIKYHFFESLV